MGLLNKINRGLYSFMLDVMELRIRMVRRKIELMHLKRELRGKKG